jgi:hypothetical protein
MGTLILFVVCLILAAAIVNGLQKLWMSFIGAEVMFFNTSWKVGGILVTPIKG